MRFIWACWVFIQASCESAIGIGTEVRSSHNASHFIQSVKQPLFSSFYLHIYLQCPVSQIGCALFSHYSSLFICLQPPINQIGCAVFQLAHQTLRDAQPTGVADGCVSARHLCLHCHRHCLITLEREGE
jgi:hypothetical protein